MVLGNPVHSFCWHVKVRLTLLQMRATVRNLARAFPTAIISGRGREKVEAFVQLKELFYAGSHGMDIAGPQVRWCMGTGQALHTHTGQLLRTRGSGVRLLPWSTKKQRGGDGALDFQGSVACGCKVLCRVLSAPGLVAQASSGGGGCNSDSFQNAFQPAAHFRPLIDQVYEQLKQR